MKQSEQTCRVLVVDDEPMMVDLIAEYLEPEGYEVITASDGEQAWQMLNQDNNHFDVLVSDRMMPNMTGDELLRRVRSNSAFRYMPVIFQTAYAAVDQIADGIRAGVYYYLSKPYEEELLVAVVRAAIQDSQHDRHLHSQQQQVTSALSALQTAEFRFRRFEEVDDLASLLSRMTPDPDRTVNGLSELLLNAVEHGNLGITYEEKGQLVLSGEWRHEVSRRQQLPEQQERWVTVQYTRSEDAVRIRISDQGAGFDFQQYLEFSPERALHAHGRGIAMSRMMSFDELHYLGSGNEVEVTINVNRGED